MPTGDFDKDIELAKLQTKISNNQTDTYALVSFGLTACIGFIVLAYSLLPSSGFWPVPVVSVMCMIIGIVFFVLSFLGLRRWRKFYGTTIPSDFDKIYRNEKIRLDDEAPT